MPSNHLILCHPLLLLPSVFPSIRVFISKSTLHIAILLTFWVTAKLFFKVVLSFYIFSSIRDSNFSSSSPTSITIVSLLFLNQGHSDGYEMIAHWAFHCAFDLYGWWNWATFYLLIGYLYIFLKKCLFKPFPSCKLFFLLLLSNNRSLNILNMCLLSNMICKY